MKLLTFFIFITFIFTFQACSKSSDPDYMKKECKEKGLTYTKRNILNYRTGEYEMRSLCVSK